MSFFKFISKQKNSSLFNKFLERWFQLRDNNDPVKHLKLIGECILEENACEMNECINYYRDKKIDRAILHLYSRAPEALENFYVKILRVSDLSYLVSDFYRVVWKHGAFHRLALGYAELCVAHEIFNEDFAEFLMKNLFVSEVRKSIIFLGKLKMYMEYFKREELGMILVSETLRLLRIRSRKAFEFMYFLEVYEALLKIHFEDLFFTSYIDRIDLIEATIIEPISYDLNKLKTLDENQIKDFFIDSKIKNSNIDNLNIKNGKSKIEKKESNIGKIESNIGKIESNIGKIESRIEKEESNIGKIESSKIKKKESNIGKIESRIEKEESKIKKKESKIKKEESKIKKEESKIKKKESKIEKEESKIKKKESKIKKKESKIEKEESNIGKIESKIDSLNIKNNDSTIGNIDKVITNHKSFNDNSDKYANIYSLDKIKESRNGVDYGNDCIENTLLYFKEMFVTVNSKTIRTRIIKLTLTYIDDIDYPDFLISCIFADPELMASLFSESPKYSSWNPCEIHKLLLHSKFHDESFLGDNLVAYKSFLLKVFCTGNFDILTVNRFLNRILKPFSFHFNHFNYLEHLIIKRFKDLRLYVFLFLVTPNTFYNNLLRIIKIVDQKDFLIKIIKLSLENN